MRIRTVKPEFWRSPDTAALSRDTRLLFVGLWNYVDDNGVGEDDVAMIRSDLFPRDDPDDIDKVIRRGLDELSARVLISRYHTPANGRRYLCVTSWHHQRIDKPSRSNKPLPTSANVVFDDASESLRRIVAEDSALYLGTKGPRERDQGTKGEPPSGVQGGLIDIPVKSTSRADTARGARITEDWEPGENCKTDLAQRYPHLNLSAVLEDFRNYWGAEAGAKARKVDWEKTFRNRCLAVTEDKRFQRVKAGPMATSDLRVQQAQALKNIPPTRLEIE